MQICKICLIEKLIEEFYKDGNNYRKDCKLCNNNKRKRNYSINSERELQNKKIYGTIHKAQITDYQTNYNIINKEKISDNKKIYYENNKQTLLNKNYKRRKKRLKNDPAFKLRVLISRSINSGIQRNGSRKNGSIIKYLNYSIDELKRHLEAQFEPWMNWENHGKYTKNWNDTNSSTWTWNIDHIIPQSDLPHTSMEDENFKLCWSLNNLRPYSAKQNILDGSNRIRHQLGRK